MHKIHIQNMGYMTFDCIMAAKFTIDTYPHWVQANDNEDKKCSYNKIGSSGKFNDGLSMESIRLTRKSLENTKKWIKL